MKYLSIKVYDDGGDLSFTTVREVDTLDEIVVILNDNVSDIYRGEVQDLVIRENASADMPEDWNVIINRTYNNTTHQLVAKLSDSMYDHVDYISIEMKER